MSFTPLTFHSEQYKISLELRNNHLWKPLGLDMKDADLSNEKNDRHFAWLNDSDKVIASAIISGSGDIVKLRQMVVHPDYQGKKIGKKLLCKIEDFMIAKGSARIELHAQVQAAGFYSKLGYKKDGEEFIEVGIPHIKMFRNLLCSTC
ncbi:MAG: GNAT family N-acetyltransferase [Lentisphaerales bacterium]|nr:GNAT family N-acetyltransferase [Lentisphaerales bacterium]